MVCQALSAMSWWPRLASRRNHHPPVALLPTRVRTDSHDGNIHWRARACTHRHSRGQQLSERSGNAPGDTTTGDERLHRADSSWPEANPPVERSTPESRAKPPHTPRQDVREARILHASIAAAIAAMAAAGAAIALGTERYSPSLLHGGNRGSIASAIAVRSPDTAERTRAEEILRSAGAETRHQRDAPRMGAARLQDSR
jgi:hypothetical protein